mgnify:CR=1 FL=1
MIELLVWSPDSGLLDAPDVKVSKKGVKKLDKLRLIVILRLRDPKLEAYEKGIKGRTEINSHLCIESRQQPGQWQWWKMQPCLGLKSQWRPPLQDYQNNFLLLLNRVNLPVTFSRIQSHVCQLNIFPPVYREVVTSTCLCWRSVKAWSLPVSFVVPRFLRYAFLGFYFI